MPQALVYTIRHKFMPTGISLCFKNNEKLPNNKNQIEKIQRCRSASVKRFFPQNCRKKEKKKEKERKRKI